MIYQQFSEPESSAWKQKTIGDIARIIGGEAKATGALADKAAEELANKAADALAVATNSYPYIQSGDLQNTRNIVTTKRILKSDAAKMRRISDQSVLLAAARPETVGRCGILSEEAIINNVIQALIPDSEQVLIDFLFYYFRLPSTQKTLRDILSNHGQPQLRFSDTQALQISLPSLDVQRRITRHLNAVIAEIQKSKSTLNNIGPKIAQTKEVSIDKFFTALEQDQSIRRVSLRDIVTPVKASLSSKDEIAQYSNLPYFPLKSLEKGGLKDDEIKPLREIKEPPAKFCIQESSPSTILYALTAPHLKRVALLKDTKHLAYSTNMIALKVTKPECDPAFCMWALIAAPFTQFISGNIIERVNQQKLLDYHLPLPSLSEQKRIADTLYDIDKTLSDLIKKQAEQRQKIEELEQNVIIQALRGEL